jgi:hypothetical protein
VFATSKQISLLQILTIYPFPPPTISPIGCRLHEYRAENRGEKDIKNQAFRSI